MRSWQRQGLSVEARERGREEKQGRCTAEIREGTEGLNRILKWQRSIAIRFSYNGCLKFIGLSIDNESQLLLFSMNRNRKRERVPLKRWQKILLALPCWWWNQRPQLKITKQWLQLTILLVPMLTNLDMAENSSRVSCNVQTSRSIAKLLNFWANRSLNQNTTSLLCHQWQIYAT